MRTDWSVRIFARDCVLRSRANMSIPHLLVANMSISHRSILTTSHKLPTGYMRERHAKSRGNDHTDQSVRTGEIALIHHTFTYVFWLLMNYLFFIFLVVTCDDTETPTNGNMMTTDEFNIGSTAIFSCSHGYMLTGGDRIRRCNESGDWTGAQPSCTRRPFLVISIDRFVCSF